MLIEGKKIVKKAKIKPKEVIEQPLIDIGLKDLYQKIFIILQIHLYNQKILILL